jgi:hypothetical protein
MTFICWCYCKRKGDWSLHLAFPQIQAGSVAWQRRYAVVLPVAQFDWHDVLVLYPGTLIVVLLLLHEQMCSGRCCWIIAGVWLKHLSHMMTWWYNLTTKPGMTGCCHSDDCLEIEQGQLFAIQMLIDYDKVVDSKIGDDLKEDEEQHWRPRTNCSILEIPDDVFNDDEDRAMSLFGGRGHERLRKERLIIAPFLTPTMNVWLQGTSLFLDVKSSRC